MVIDSHTHVDRVEGFWDSPPERIIGLMDEAGIDKSVIMPYSDNPDLVKYMRDCVKKYPNRLIAYARLNPAEGDEAQKLLKESVEKWGIKGLKLHPVGNFVHPASGLSVELIKLAAELRIPTLFHSGDEELTLPLQILACARKVPEANIILGHMGGYFHTEDAIIAAEKCSNIYLETSAMPYPELIKEAVNRIGAERVLFASDGPGCPPDLELKKVRIANLKIEDEKMVLNENIRKLLKI